MCRRLGRPEEKTSGICLFCACTRVTSGSSAFLFCFLHCLMVCASFRVVPSKTLHCFHGYAPRQSSGKTKDEEKVLIIGHQRSIEGFEEQLLPWLRKW